MRSKDNEDSDDKDESKGIVWENNTNELHLLETNNTITTLEDITNKNIKESAWRKYKGIDSRNKAIMRNTIALLECNTIKNLSELAIKAILAIDNA